MSAPSEPRTGGARRPPWRLAIVLVVVVLVGALPFARNLLDRRDEQLATNTRSPVSKTSQDLRSGALVCADARRDPLLSVPKGTTAVRVYPGYQGRRAPRLSVSVTGGGTELRGTTPAAYASGQPVVVGLDRKAPRRLTRVCLRNRGPVSVALARASDPQGNDAVTPIALGAATDQDEDRRSVRIDVIGRRDALAVSLVGGALDHATAFKPDGVGPVVIGGGLVLVLVLGLGAVALVARAPDDLEPVAVAAGAAGGGPADGDAAPKDGGATDGTTPAEDAAPGDGTPTRATTGADGAATTGGGSTAATGTAAAGGAILGGAAAAAARDHDDEPEPPHGDEPEPGREGPHGGSWANDAHPGETDAAGPIDAAPSGDTPGEAPSGDPQPEAPAETSADAPTDPPSGPSDTDEEAGRGH